jgi:hypothetical protein
MRISVPSKLLLLLGLLPGARQLTRASSNTRSSGARMRVYLQQQQQQQQGQHNGGLHNGQQGQHIVASVQTTCMLDHGLNPCIGSNSDAQLAKSTLHKETYAVPVCLAPHLSKYSSCFTNRPNSPVQQTSQSRQQHSSEYTHYNKVRTLP